MSDFEFMSVLVSIVIGIGLAHLLAGLGRAFFQRDINRLDPVHLAWTITVFFVLVLNWWVFLLWRDFTGWSFPMFFTLVLWTTSYYMLTVILYPPDLPEKVNYRELFERNRTWFLGSFAVMCTLDIVVTTQREGGLPDTLYLGFVSHYALIAIVGALVRNRHYDLASAWYILITLAGWSFGVRNTIT